MLARPRAPTPSRVSISQDDWNSDYDPQSPDGLSPTSGHVVASPPSMLTPPPVINSHSLSALGYTAYSSSNNDEEGALSDSGYSHSSSQRSTSVVALPDPSQFPDPYPYRRPSRWQIGTNTPALSSADSSSASTRSSAYTGSAKSGDYGHVHVAFGDDESGRGVGVGITTDDVVQLLSKEPGATATTQGRTPVDQTRWSDFYQNGIRSRSSSLANSKAEPVPEKAIPPLRGSPSFDMGWQRPDERDEAGLSDDEAYDDPSFDDDEDDEPEEPEEEPTSAALLAEEGRGIIVRAEDTPLVRLHVPQGSFRPCRLLTATINNGSASYRHHALDGRILLHAKRHALLPCHDTTSDMLFPALSRHICQLPECAPTITGYVHQPRGVEHRVKSASCSANLLGDIDQSSCSHGRCDRYQHSSVQSGVPGEAAHPEHPEEQDAFIAELAVRVARIRDTARRWEPFPRALEGAYGTPAYSRASVPWAAPVDSYVPAALCESPEHIDVYHR